MSTRIKSILVANRGEIACRVIRTAHDLGLRAYAVYSDADEDALHVKLADGAARIGPAQAADSYLRGDKIIAAAKALGADAIHPGYGFLSENPDFADACADDGLIFIGPPASAMQAMALKGAAKALMEDAGVPVVPGYHGDDQSVETLSAEAMKIGLPVLIKAVAGGGGKGMRLVEREDELGDAIESAAREGKASFGNPKVLIEKYISRPRHIEFQVFGDQHGEAVHLWERDCSLQRRHQKVVEEAPAPGMTTETRRKMGEAAVRAAKAIGYVGAGTVEFIVDASTDDFSFYFMEMNTRLQVEHPVTEMIVGADLVAWQIAVAEGQPLPMAQADVDVSMSGHAVEVRLYAEDPARNYAPQTGLLSLFDPYRVSGDNQRIDSGVQAGDEISIHYDPMIGKFIAWGEDRESAIDALQALLVDTPIGGVVTNRDYLIRILGHNAFRSGDVSTGFLAEHAADLLPKPDAKDTAPYALAAVAITARRLSHSHTSPFGINDGFTLNAPPAQHLDFEDTDDRLIAVTCITKGTAVDIHIDDQSFHARIDALDGDRLVVEFDGILRQIWCDVSDDQVTVVDGGHTHRLKRRSRGSVDVSLADGPGAITAPMPGKILSVSVKQGQTVAKGDALLVMEAMKMEQRIPSPRDGKVTELHVEEGMQVADGALLCLIEDNEDG